MAGNVPKTYVFFSAAAARLFGYDTLAVPDGAGGAKTVDYTRVSDNPEGTGYGWQDKQLVWSGSKAGCKWLGRTPGEMPRP